LLLIVEICVQVVDSSN